MISAVTGVLGNLFGTQQSAEKALDYVARGVDALWHTDEEKAHEAAEAKREAFQRVLSWLEATKGSRLARRLIALVVVGIWALTLVSAIVLAVSAIWADPVMVKVVVDGTVEEVMLNRPRAASELLFTQVKDQKDLVIWVLAFYFGAPIALDAGRAVIQKHFKKSPDADDMR